MRDCELPPADVPLGFIWRPPGPDGPDGPLAIETVSDVTLEDLARGTIRVRCICRECKGGYDGWMFASYFERHRSDFPDPDNFDVGRRGSCGMCLERAQQQRQRRELEYELESLKRRWEAASTKRKTLPVAKRMKVVLIKLLDCTRFGSDRFERCSESLEKVESWLQKNDERAA